ncbi:Serine/arginine repetitive matrix-like protein [Quillaja saponaria]|uniref:Serine/arginine repetitive matrix-like protein n=1 Tax=Quillaja saponaria TaxID=32244 RepID=A0AAD7QIC2_QUISA|nr:Serine/arginine repetitive matrix-like protein [Quillaja saponaria]
MASACVNNIGMLPENFIDCSRANYQYGWLSPRVSLSLELADKDLPKPHFVEKQSDQLDKPDPEAFAGDFEFRLEDPVTMLPADELFSDGKLMPLHHSSVKPCNNFLTSPEIRSPETAKFGRRSEISSTDPYIFSPKAPRCSSRWREILGLKKLNQNTSSKNETQKTTSLSSNTNPKSLKYFLYRSSKSSSSSSSDASLSLPLLKDSDCESVSISSRLSLSSSSSGHEHEDLPRLSLDSDKPNPISNPNPISLHRNPNPGHPRIRMVKPRANSSDSNSKSLIDHPTATRPGRSPIRRAPGESAGVSTSGISVDSPRMNSSGKIVFQSLERSSSSPSSFNGGPRYKHRGMERSYSANVRVTPVLNVPVCSLRGSSKSVSVFGFGQLFSSSPQKRESSGNGGGGGGSNRSQYGNSRNRTDRT